MHLTDIKEREHITLHIDLGQRGVGGDNSWGAMPHSAYRMHGKQYSYGYVVGIVE